MTTNADSVWVAVEYGFWNGSTAANQYCNPQGGNSVSAQSPQINSVSVNPRLRRKFLTQYQTLDSMYVPLPSVPSGQTSIAVTIIARISETANNSTATESVPIYVTRNAPIAIAVTSLSGSFTEMNPSGSGTRDFTLTGTPGQSFNVSCADTTYYTCSDPGQFAMSADGDTTVTVSIAATGASPASAQVVPAVLTATHTSGTPTHSASASITVRPYNLASALSFASTPTTGVVGAPHSYSILVTNTGEIGTYFALNCNVYQMDGVTLAPSSNCNPQGAAVWAPKDGSGTGQVSVITSTPGNYLLRVTASAGSSVSSMMPLISSRNPIYDVAVEAHTPLGTAIEAGTTRNVTVTVRNNGDFSSAFSVACTASGVTDATCTTSPQTTSSLAKSATTTLTYAVFVPATAAHGTLSLAFAANGVGNSASGTYGENSTVLAHHATLVASGPGTLYNTQSGPASFTLTNDGDLAGNYTFSCTVLSGPVTCTGLTSSTPMPLSSPNAATGSATITAHPSATGAAQVRFNATGPFPTSTIVNVTVRPPVYNVAVDTSAMPTSVTAGGSTTAVITVRNLSEVPAAFTLGCARSGSSAGHTSCRFDNNLESIATNMLPVNGTQTFTATIGAHAIALQGAVTTTFTATGNAVAASKQKTITVNGHQVLVLQPNGASDSLKRGIGTDLTFKLKNTGPISGTYSATCSVPSPSTCVFAPPGSEAAGPIAENGEKTYTVHILTNNASSLNVTFGAGGSATSSQLFPIPVRTPRSSYTFTAPNLPAVGNGKTDSVLVSLTNSGETGGTYTVSSCTQTGGMPSVTCSVATPGSAGSQGGTSFYARVTAAAGSAAGTATLTLTLNDAQAGSVTRTFTANVFRYGVVASVASKADTIPIVDSRAFSYSVAGTAPASANVTFSCGAPVSGCAITSTPSVALGTTAITVAATVTADTTTGPRRVVLRIAGDVTDSVVTMTEVVRYRVVATARSTNPTRAPINASTSFQFDVKNEGSHAAPFALTCTRTTFASCAVAGVGGSATTAQLAPGATEFVTLSAVASSAVGQGIVSIDARDGTKSSGQAFDTAMVYRAGVTLAVVPPTGEVAVDSGAVMTREFTVTNTGSMPDSVTFVGVCTGAACTPTPLAALLGVGGSRTVTLTHTAGTFGATGSLALSATSVTNGGGPASATAEYRVRHTYRVRVVASPAAAGPREHQAKTFAFRIYNDGSATGTYTLTPSCNASGAYSGSCAPSATSVTVPSLGVDSVTIGPLSGPANTQVTVGLSARAHEDSSAVGSGTAHLGVLPSFVVAVTPVTQTLIRAVGSQILPVKIANRGSDSSRYTLLVTCTRAATACGAATGSTVLLPAGDSTTVDVPFWLVTPDSMGTVRIVVISNRDGFYVDSAAATIWVARQVAVSPRDTLAWADQARLGIQRFVVQNTGMLRTRYAISVQCPTGWTPGSCTVDSSYVDVDSASSKIVQARFLPGIGSVAGRVTLRAMSVGYASVQDSGWVNTQFTVRGRLLVSSDATHSDSTITRDQCVTIAARTGAFNCGDLVLAHALPEYRSVGKSRSLTLVYNSQHASPRPSVAVDVTLPPGIATPDTVEIILSTAPDVFGAPSVWIARDTVRVGGGVWPLGGTQRVVLSYAGTADTTGVYRFRIDLKSRLGGIEETVVSDTGRLIVVNRSRSQFGSGWWLGGVERLVSPNARQMLWVGGDGSARIFYRPDPSPTRQVWYAQSVEQPDSIYYQQNSFVRMRPDRSMVKFENGGLHKSTVDAQGRSTVIDYVGRGAIRNVAMTPAQLGNNLYVMAIDSSGVDPIVTRIRAPIAAGNDTSRSVYLGRTAGRLTSLHAPQMWSSAGAPDSILFAYAGSQDRIVSRRDRRKVWTRFAYDSGGKLSAASTRLGGNDSILVVFEAAESRGMIETGGPRPAEGVSTLLDGPREAAVGDTTRFWINRFGAVTRTRNAVGHETRVQRGDTRFPLAVTQMESPVEPVTGATGGYLVTRATFDSRGRVTTAVTVDPYGTGGDSAMTRYGYDDHANRVNYVESPTGIVTRRGYDSVTFNVKWEQAGNDATRRVQFVYENSACRLPIRVILPGDTGVPLDTVRYDGRCNPSAVRARNGVWSAYLTDNAGRVTTVMQPQSTVGWGNLLTNVELFGPRSRTVYDASGRVSATYTRIGNAAQTAVDSVLVRHTYDAEGNVLSTSRRSRLDEAGLGVILTSWAYDSIGRVVRETAPVRTTVPETLPFSDSTVYDLAGNVVETLGRRHDPISGGRLSVHLSYDPLNRLITRVTDAVTYDTLYAGIPAFYPWINTINTQDVRPGEMPAYPRYRNFDSGRKLRIPGDTAIMRYDRAGNLVVADNRDARIRRAYFPNGQLRADTLSTRAIEAEGDEGFGGHVYGLEYRYDLDGRRVELKHPSQLAYGAATDRVHYGYHAATGDLISVTDVQDTVYRFHYNARRELDSLHLPLGVSEGFAYDLVGNLIRHTSLQNGVGSWFRDNSREYNARGQLTRSANLWGYQDTLFVSYDAFGRVATDTTRARGRAEDGHRYTQITAERFTHDGMGNLLLNYSKRTVTSPDNDFQNRYSSQRQRLQRYEPETGRLNASKDDTPNPVQIDTTIYDAAGNVHFSTQKASPLVLSNNAGAVLDDRVTYYGADNRIYAADYRTSTTKNFLVGVFDTLPPETVQWSVAFEEYRYDALGRRIFVRARRHCEKLQPFECRLSYVRRTVWDGDAELWEIQRPGLSTPHQMESDTATLGLDVVGNQWHDQNPYYGRVAYTYGMGIDRPLSVVRFNYETRVPVTAYTTEHKKFEPLQVVLFWTADGKVDDGFHISSQFSSYGPPCLPESGGAPPRHCVTTIFPHAYDVLAYGNWNPRPTSFQGSLINDKRDAAGTYYRRNRVYDPATGRFTQEDPIGLAGGINLYGYASGDPINGRDPFGLCDDTRPCPMDQIITTISTNIRNALSRLSLQTLELSKAAIKETAIQVGLAVTTEGVGNAIRLARSARHIALGIQAAGLEGRAAAIGAEHLMKDAAYRATLMAELGNPSTKFTVMLDGVEGGIDGVMSLANAGISRGRLASPFQWEMGQVLRAGRLKDVTFMLDGKVVLNPF